MPTNSLKFTGRQLHHIHTVIVDAYTREDLRRVVRVCLEQDLDALASNDLPFKDQTFALVEWAARQDRVLELIDCVYEGNPSNHALQRLWQEQHRATPAAQVSPTYRDQDRAAIPEHFQVVTNHTRRAAPQHRQKWLLALGFSTIIVAVIAGTLLAGRFGTARTVAEATPGAPIAGEVRDPAAAIPATPATADTETAGIGDMTTGTGDSDGEAAPGVGSTRNVGDLPFVFVPAGEFSMGASPAHAEQLLELCPQNHGCEPDMFGNAEPLHTLDLSDYWIQQTEVTNATWRAFLDAGGYDQQAYWTDEGWQWRSDNDITQPECWEDGDVNADDQPVVCVSWFEAAAFARWFALETGTDAHLPSEAEWEKAARGTDNRLFPWGDAWDSQNANYCDDNCISDMKDASGDDGYAQTAPVGNYPGGASPYGALDMAGNAWEWTSSIYAPYPYDAGDGREDAEVREIRTLRGGSWDYGPELAALLYRSSNEPDVRYSDVGFRLAISTFE